MKLLVSLAILASSLLFAHSTDLELEIPTPFVGSGVVSVQQPYIVSIRQQSREQTEGEFGNGHVCNGVLISRTRVLTAASCIVIRENRIPTNDFVIVAGTRYRYNRDEAVIVSARNITIHPQYTFDPVENNLAIIEVRIDLIFKTQSLIKNLFT